MIFDILTLFPGIFESPLRESILGKAVSRGLVTVRLHNLRDYAEGKHRITDDRPFGGGEGMVMKPEPIVHALEAIRPDGPEPHVVLMSPQGRLFTQEVARKFAALPRIVLICGRYEGVDERIARFFVHEEVSVGDFILTGGELAALVVVDSVARLIPGVLGNEASPEAESFRGAVLEHPHYTRPREFRGHRVPEVLLSGNHEKIRRWRRQQALVRTRERRPDLFQRLRLNREDRELLDEYDRTRKEQ